MQLLLYVQEEALARDNEAPRTVSTLSPAASEDLSRTCSGYKTPDPHIHPHQPLCISSLMVWTHLKAKGNLMRSAVMSVVLLTSGPLRCKKTSENTMMDYKNTEDCKASDKEENRFGISRKSGRTGTPLSHCRPFGKRGKVVKPRNQH
ncbi:hypothetical protein QQF64_028395 [Cirrhinus molitorella]|uniref:Kisspeptin n=1 Tax=Cirrhinus molitorella TaxID=172907 RepID=A0ABR3N6I7_9TELE